MILVDTGFFLALTQPRDALHERAVRWAQAIAEPLLVTDDVLWETVNALSALPDRPRAHLLLEHVRTSTGYEVVAASTELTAAGVRLHAERPDRAWSLTDCVSFVVITDRDIRLALAYDHHFEHAGFEALLRRDPP
jgi:predicted nucleic acid-binding protein